MSGRSPEVRLIQTLLSEEELVPTVIGDGDGAVHAAMICPREGETGSGDQGPLITGVVGRRSR